MWYGAMRQVYPYLTIAGAIPFWFCAICLMLDIQTVPVLGDVQNILMVYGLVISSFLAGSHWGQHLHIDGRWKILLPLSSNVIAVLLWFAYVVLAFKAMLVGFGVSFVILLLIDKMLHQEKIIDSDYYRIRIIVTVLVVASLIVSGVFV